MDLIKKIRINIQRDQGRLLIPSVVKPDQLKQEETISGMLNQDKKENYGLGKTSTLINDNGKLNVVFDKKDDKLIDGYWIILQNWSQCTLKCGGGKSYLQRMCIPPKNGGKPCEGESIIDKDCNKIPCPSHELNQQKNNTNFLKPIIKIIPFSNRPQRYSKCVIKEGDMMYTKDLKENDQMTSDLETNQLDSNTVQIPVKVIMNNRTLSIFTGEEYDTIITGFNLKTSKFIIDKLKPECFFIKEHDGKTSRLCAFSCDNSKKAVEEWDYDFNLFKNQCNNYVHLKDDLEKKLNDKIKVVKEDLLFEVQDNMKKKAQEEEEKKLTVEIKQTNKIALQAIQKQINLEEMIKLEEIEREKREENQMLIMIEQEKKKSVNKIYHFLDN